MSVRDAELLKFMQTHDLHDGPGDRLARRDFGMGRPVREVCGALRKITSTNQNDTAIYSNVVSNRMYGVHAGGGTEWVLANTPANA